VQYHRRRL